MFCLLYNTFQREICLVSFLKSHYNISFVSGFSEAFPGTVSAAFENPRKSKCVLLPSSRTSLRLPGKGKDVSHTLLLGTHRRERAKWDRSEERRATLHSLPPNPPTKSSQALPVEAELGQLESGRIISHTRTRTPGRWDAPQLHLFQRMTELDWTVQTQKIKGYFPPFGLKKKKKVPSLHF